MTTLELGDGIRVFGLFEGYGGLSQGIIAVTGGELVGYAEYEPPTEKHPNPSQAPARLLAHHHPTLTNYGDVTAIDWARVKAECDPTMLAGGFPCQDVSTAGLRAGLSAGTRSGMWYPFAKAIETIQPALVLIENVPGLRSARAGDPNETTEFEAIEDETDEWIATVSGMEPGTWTMGEPERDGRPVLRAFGAVAGDLAELGYDTEWISVRASDVGAPHRRERVFIMAYASWLDGITDPRGLAL